MKDELVIGRIRTAFGLGGEVKVELFGGDLAYFTQLDEVTLQRGEKREKRTIESARPNGSTCLVRFSGIESPEAAKELRNAEIVVPREKASPPGPGEYYYADLLGLKVLADGEQLGDVSDILEGNGAVFLQISVAGGQTRIVPFNRTFVPEVCVDDGELSVRDRELLE